MAAKLIQNIRTGQARLSDQLIAAELTQSGAVAVDDISRVMPDCEPGRLGPELVNQGYISVAELSRAEEEIAIATLMDTVGGFQVPAEVSVAAEDRERRLGRYILVDELGAGGMGVVWRAWDEKLSRWVAVKQVKVKDPQLIRRFMQEARLLASLSHPHITQVFEVGVHTGKPYLVMELVEGGTPGQDGPMGRREAARIVRDAARAVQFAHDHDIVHRDLKPSNLLVSKHDRVFVTDFGLARMREEGNQLTQTGALLGTPAFMAPEQAQGKSADSRTDIYGLGATLYALVQGEPPYTGEVVHELVKRVALANPPSIEGADDLVVVAQKAMERDREDRYASAAELADDLQRFIDDEPIAARPIGSVERVWRRARRNPLRAAAIAAAALVLSVTLSWGGTELASYAKRASQISAASEPLGQLESLTEQIKHAFLVNATSGPAFTTTMQRYNESLEAARAVAPDYAEVHYYSGMAELWNGDTDAADAAFGRALIDDPLHQEARGRRLLMRLSVDEFSPSFVESENGVSVEAVALDEEQQARLSLLEEDLEYLAENATLRELSQAWLYSTRGEFAQARERLESYLAANPLDMKSRSTLLYALFDQGDYDAIDAHAAELIRSGQFVDQAHHVRAFALGNRGDYDAAIALMRESIALSNDLSDMQWVALWQRWQGDNEAAESTYRDWYEADPSDLHAAQMLIDTYLERGKFDDAIAALDPLLLKAPGDTELNYLAGVARTESNPEAALLHFRIAAEDPEFPVYGMESLGDLEFAAGQWESGVAQYQQAAAAGSAYAAERLASHFNDVGEPERVADALSGYTHISLAQYHLARASLSLGDLDEAKKSIDRAIELNANDIRYVSLRGRISIVSGAKADGERDLDAARLSSPDSFHVHRDTVEAWLAVGNRANAERALTRWQQLAPQSFDGPYYQTQIEQLADQ